MPLFSSGSSWACPIRRVSQLEMCYTPSGTWPSSSFDWTSFCREILFSSIVPEKDRIPLRLFLRLLLKSVLFRLLPEPKRHTGMGPYHQAMTPCALERSATVERLERVHWFRSGHLERFLEGLAHPPSNERVFWQNIRFSIVSPDQPITISSLQFHVLVGKSSAPSSE